MQSTLRTTIALAGILLSILPAHKAEADILVAVPGPTDGPRGVLAREIRRGVEAAAADINAKGGVLGEKLTVATVDDRCTDDGGRASATDVIAKGATLVIGHPCTNAALAAAPLYAKARILFMAPSVRHPALTSSPEQATAGLTFRLAGRDDRQGEAAAAWLLTRAPNRAIAIVHDRTAYAKAIAEATEKKLKEQGVSPVVLTIVAGHRDYPEITDPVTAKSIEAMVFAGFPDEAAIILTGLRAKGSKTAFLGSDSLATPSFSERAAADSSIVRVLYPRDGTQSLEARARMALEAWSLAAARANSRDAADIQKTLRAAPLATNGGELAFDAEGNLTGPSYAAAKAGLSSWIPEEEASGLAQRP